MAVSQVAEKTRTYIAKYSDGVSEQFIAKYVANVDDERSESGHPSEPLNGWFTDNRQCHWTIKSNIVRQVGLVSKSGQTFWQPGLSQLFLSQKDGKGSDLILTNLASENCGDAEPRHQSDVKDVTNAIVAHLDVIVQQDSDKVAQDLQAQLRAVSVAAT